jgi:cytochrome P450
MLSHINSLVSILYKHAEQRQPIDIVKYFEFITSDIISDFCFAESYGQLKSSEQEPVITAMHKFIPLQAKLSAFTRWIRIVLILRLIGVTQLKMLAKAEDQVRKRIEKGSNQKDMMKHVLGHMSEDGDGMSMAELGQNAMILMLAGSETSATTLAGAMFYLLQNQGVLDRLTKEIRDSFQSSDDITIVKVRVVSLFRAHTD